MDSSELTLGMPAYCRPMIMLRKSSFWAMLKACCRTRTKSGLNDLWREEHDRLGMMGCPWKSDSKKDDILSRSVEQWWACVSGRCVCVGDGDGPRSVKE